ncbi:unnamed protein product [Cuscuta campestris]|uniref:Transposase (putative) gypsy type domain-containing protein n=1 Tax=Cuscuta campestris TaxID=132261 RepID=A0A484LA73_9ASTE|nr:unnamed protein product [Cuscuta campestris]
MSDHEDSQNPSTHSYGSGDRAQTSGSSSSSSSDSEHLATSPQKKPVDASTCAPSSSVAQVVLVAQPEDEGFILLDDRLLQTQSLVMQKAQVHEVRNLMPDGYQLTYRATWKSIIPLHVGTSIDIHYHSIKDLGEFSIHPFKVLFLETYGIMPGQLAPNGHRLLGSFINVCRFLRIPLSLRLFDHMFDFRPGSKIKRQVKPTEADDLVARENTLQAGDASTRGLYHVGKWSVYPGRETDPEPEIVLPEAIPEAIPIRQARGPKAQATATAGPSCPGKKKKEKVVKFQSKFATPKIVVKEPSTAQLLSQPSVQPVTLDEQPVQSQQGTSQPIHSGELYINVDTLEFDQLMEAGQANQLAEGGHDEEEAAEESLKRKRRNTEVVDQPAHQAAQSSDAGKRQSQPWSMALMSRSNEELLQAFRADLTEVDRIGEEYFTRRVKSRDEEKARMEAMMVECRKEAKAAFEKAAKAEEKLMDHCAVYRQLYVKHDDLLKAAKEADEQAHAKIQQLEAENARSAEEIARLGDELEKERSERAPLAAAWAVQAPEEFAAQALPERETAIRFFHGLYKHEVSAGIIDEIGTYGFNKWSVR